MLTMGSISYCEPVVADVLPVMRWGQLAKISFLVKHSSAAADEDTTMTRKEPKRRGKTEPMVLQRVTKVL